MGAKLPFCSLGSGRSLGISSWCSFAPLELTCSAPTDYLICFVHPGVFGVAGLGGGGEGEGLLVEVELGKRVGS